MTVPNDVLIRLAGSFAVERDGVPYPRGVVGGKARTLLKLLAAERGRAVAADRVVAALWPGGGPRRPAENVATLVSRLRGALGPGVVTGGRHGYRLGGPPGVLVDLDVAAALAGEAEGCLGAGEPALAGAAAGRALELLHEGAVLEGEPHDAGWVVAAREEAAGLVRRARHAAATAGLRTADPASARRAAEGAVHADPFDEVAHRLLMRAHVAAGEPAKALLAYERLRQRLSAELGTDPAAETRAVHLAILREEPVRTPQPAEPVRAPHPAPASRTAPVSRTAAPEAADAVAVPYERGPAGRAGEVARLAAAWAQAAAGRTGVLLICGEAGIGKSRLATEAERMAGATGGIVLRARCHEVERALFLQPFVDALRPRVAHLAGQLLRDMVGGWAPALESLSQGQPMERRYAYEAVTAFLRALAEREPVLLVLEDLHAAGAASVELVHYLARRTSGVRLLVVATVRTDDEAVTDALRGLAEVVRLGPLPPGAVAELAAGAGLGELADEVFRRTRGHPQLVVALLGEPGAIRHGVPASLRAIVLARLSGLGDQARGMLRAASVLGAAAFDPALLGEMLGLPPQVVAEHCERALGRGLLVVSGSAYEFAGDLIREALHSSIPAPTLVVYQDRARRTLLVPQGGPPSGRLTRPGCAVPRQGDG